MHCSGLSPGVAIFGCLVASYSVAALFPSVAVVVAFVVSCIVVAYPRVVLFLVALLRRTVWLCYS